MNDDDVRAYLNRLELEAEPPSAAALFRLHRAQVEHVPYETVWIHLGEAWTLDPEASTQRVAHQGRGGYCYHVNGAFSELLRALGYDVTRHVGGVHDAAGATEAEMANHLVLSVAGLPTEENPDGVWYVDVGLGDALYEPLPLREGEYQQGPFRYSLDATPRGLGDWTFTHDARGSFKAMSWYSAPADMRDFAAQHERLSTAPDSIFVQFLIVQRRDATGTDVMIGLGLRRVGSGADQQAEVLTDRADWFAVLTDRFGLRLDHVEPAALDRLWEKTLAAHHAWEAQRASKPR